MKPWWNLVLHWNLLFQVSAQFFIIDVFHKYLAHLNQIHQKIIYRRFLSNMYLYLLIIQL